MAFTVSMFEKLCITPWRFGVRLVALSAAVTICSDTLASGHSSPTEADSGADPHAAAAAAAGVKIRGVELGEYKIRANYPVEAQKSTVTFVLHATVASERYDEARRLVEAHRNRVRDQVITVTRMTPLALLDEPELTSFRRRILMRLRRALPELPIDDVYVSDFQLTVKSL
jgi:hypothetical protein